MNNFPIPKQAHTVFLDYQSRVQSLHILIAASRSRKIRALAICLACSTASFAALILALKWLGPLFAAVPFFVIVAIWQFQTFSRYSAKLVDSVRRSAFYEKGIDRIEDKWRGKANAGLEFAREHHLYQSDLDILGEGSLFELISTTRSEIGSERLASFLLDTPTFHEAQARQNAVKELRGAIGLREEVAILGKYQFHDCRKQHLSDWLNLPVLVVPRIVSIFLLFSSAACLLLDLCGLARILPWLQIVPALAPLLIAQAYIGLVLMRRIRIHIKMLLAIVGI
jgi:hypothetical protein